MSAMLQKKRTALRHGAPASFFSVSLLLQINYLKINQIFNFFSPICPICTDQKAAGVIEVIPVGEQPRERERKMIIKCFTGLCQG